MSDRPKKVLLVDQDPIFRLGLRVALEQIPDLQVISEAQTDTAALEILAELAKNDPKSVNLVILELAKSRLPNGEQLNLQLCRQIKIQYPNLPILLLTCISEPGLLLAAKSIGVNGYCPKGTPVSELLVAIQEVASGGSYWDGGNNNSSLVYKGEITPLYNSPPLPFSKLRNNLRLSGIDNINASLAEVTAKLQVPGLPLLDRAILAGHRRELLTASWLVNRLLATPEEREYEENLKLAGVEESAKINPPLMIANSLSDSPKRQNSPLLSPRTLQASLFSSCIAKLQFPFKNLSDEPLEIDIFRPDKKRELFYNILQKLADALDELRVSHIEVYQLDELKNIILRDLWQTGIRDFFGKFTKVQVGNQNLEIATLLMQSNEVVQTEILQKIPLVVELLSYLLFQTDLYIDNTIYAAGSSQAMEQCLMILENLLIQVANSVVQPLLNSLGDVEAIKQSFYDRQFISTREIERFRNELSWKYRWSHYVDEAQAIFESRYELFVFTPRGIAKTAIYAPRSQELSQLSGIPLIVTLALEFRDAIAPRLKSLLSLVGSGVVFVLTKVVGRGLGLIGRGILQGIGNVSFSERKNKDL